MYDKLKKVHEQTEEYFGKADIHFYFEDGEQSADSVTVQVPFTIDMEYRSWGLKYIGLILSSTIDIPYTLTDKDGNESDQEISVDLSKLKEEWYEGDGYTVDELSLNIKKDGTIDYDKSSIDLSYIKKG